MWCKLGNCCHIAGRIGFRGYTKDDLVSEQQGAITLSPSNIIDGIMNYTKCTYISWSKYEESPEIKVTNGDILLVKTGSSYGKCALVTELPQEATINPQFVVLKYIAINKRYLTMILQSDYAQRNYNNFVLGTAIPTFTQAILGDMLVPLPPIMEQQRIVADVERWFALIDQVEQGKADLQTIIKQTKSKILDLAIHGKLVPQDPNDEPAIELLKCIHPDFTPCDNAHYPQLPKSWCLASLGDLCSLCDGRKRVEEYLPYIDVKYLRKEKSAETISAGKYVAKGGLLILVDGENSGEVFRAPCNGYQGSTFKQLVINNNVHTEYLLLIIEMSRKMLRENKVGSAIPHLNKKIFKSIPVHLPPYQEQTRIVDEVTNLNKLLDVILESL